MNIYVDNMMRMHLTLFATVFDCADDLIRLKKVLNTRIQINTPLLYFR